MLLARFCALSPQTKSTIKRRGPMHEPVRLSYRLTDEEKRQIMNQKLRPQDVVRRAHERRAGKHKRIAARPAKPSNVPTGWEVRWSESAEAWYYWCPVTNVTCWDVSECKHDAAAVQKVVKDRGHLPLDSPYVKYALKADALRHQKDCSRAERIKERRRAQSAGPRRPQSAGGRSLAAAAQPGRPQSARVESTFSSARYKGGPHPPSSSEAVIALRSANLASAAAARAAAPRPPPHRSDAVARSVQEAKEAPWMLGHPADKYGRVPVPPREAQLWDRRQEGEAQDKENAAYKAQCYGRGPGYRKHCMRVDAPRAVHELQDFESRNFRSRGNPGMPREYLHVRPKHQRVLSVDGGDAEVTAIRAAFQAGDHVWLAVDPTATLKNGSGLFEKRDPEELHLGPFSKRSQPSFEQAQDGILTKPTGVVKTVQASSGDCLVEWGVVGHCPPGMPRKLLWCTPDELRKVPARKKIMSAMKSSMMMRTLSMSSARSGAVENESSPRSPRSAS